MVYFLEVGELNLTAALLGKSDLGVGSIVTIDGNNVSDYENRGKGNNRIDIEDGVGTINLEFQEPDFI